MTIRFAGLALVAVFALACSHPEKDTARVRTVDWSDSDKITAEQEIALRRAMVDLEGWQLAVSPDVESACPGANSTVATMDTAWQRAQWKRAIVALADCMKNGNLRSEDLQLVGHQAPGGHDKYDMHEGRERALRIRQALVELGVDESRVAVKRHRLPCGQESGTKLEGTPDAMVEVGVRAPVTNASE